MPIDPHPPETLVLRHGALPNMLAAGLASLLGLVFLWRWWAGSPGVAALVLPALFLFGLFGGSCMLRAADRRPVARIGETGILLPAIMDHELPWAELQEMAERRFGRTRLIFYVADTSAYLKPEVRSAWTLRAMVGKLRPDFARPAIELETSWLDRDHAAIREAAASHWGWAKQRGRA